MTLGFKEASKFYSMKKLGNMLGIVVELCVVAYVARDREGRTKA
jgi:hypothetical protein